MQVYSKTCGKRPPKNRENKGLKTNGCLMKVETIAECSRWNILPNFWPALSNNWLWKPILVFFLGAA